MLLPCSQISCKILGLLWPKLRDSQLIQMDKQGSWAEQSDNIELSQLKQYQRALELLFLQWLYVLPTIEAWKASTLHLFAGQRVLGQLVGWTPQFHFLMLSCILKRTSPMQSGGGSVFGSHTPTSFLLRGVSVWRKEFQLGAQALKVD